MGIGDLLEKNFNIKKAFLKEPKIKSLKDNIEIQKLTDSGEKAYSQLVELLSDLDVFTNGSYNLSKLVAELGEVIDG